MTKRFRLALFATFVILVVSIAAFAQQERCTEDGSIRSVTKAHVGNFDTVTIEINGSGPTYDVKTAHRPFTFSESDDPVHIRGIYFKEINFKSVLWTCKIAENFAAKTSNIMDVKQTDQFEGYVSYAVGYRTNGSYVGTTKTRVGKRTRVVMKFRR